MFSRAHIPPVYHLVDFREAPRYHSKYIERCTKSRKKFLKGWEQRVWTEDDFVDIIGQLEWSVPFGNYLLSHGYWAIVSDIIRLYALYTEGGMYIDWDVEFVKEIPPAMCEHEVYLGFEPYTHNGRGTFQVGVQCSLSAPKHPLWRYIYERIVSTIWTPKFDILPGISTSVLVEEYDLPSPRNKNSYYYLFHNITVAPYDVFYPFMGTRIFETDETLTEEKLYRSIAEQTVALHWEFSQIKEVMDMKKKGWTEYLHLLREPPIEVERGHHEV